MELLAFSIHDSKSKTFGPPMMAKTYGEAERNLKTAVNGDSGNLSKYPEDYTLFQIGTWDDNTGQFNPCEPKSIVPAVQLKD